MMRCAARFTQPICAGSSFARVGVDIPEVALGVAHGGAAATVRRMVRLLRERGAVVEGGGEHAVDLRVARHDEIAGAATGPRCESERVVVADRPEHQPAMVAPAELRVYDGRRVVRVADHDHLGEADRGEEVDRTIDIGEGQAVEELRLVHASRLLHPVSWVLEKWEVSRDAGPDMHMLMCIDMSALERRLHLLLDQDRHDRLVAEAERTGRSVNAVIRAAIDEHFDEQRDQVRRAAAARLLLASAAAPGSEPAETWEQMLAAQDADLQDSLRP